MDFDKEINNIKSILRGKFADPNDRKYWEDKLRELETRKTTSKMNEQFFKSYEKGVDAFKKYRYPYKY